MKIRLFGSTECKDCLKVFIFIKRSKIDFEYIDAFSPDENIQEFCDEHNVDELSHIQFLDNENNIIIEHKGAIDGEELINYVKDYFNE